MVLIRLLHRLLNNPQLIEKLSESRPIRRSAQITAFAITKAQLAGKDTVQRLMRSDTVRQGAFGGPGDIARRVARIKDSFVKDVRVGLEDMKSQMRRQGGGK
ncbi:protein NCBP2AS2 [Pseudophryne corroboree]|uniref:protein NCBP2AS2 n=1 Tax=Pseudophryne corroboree TaxID=495146 RepID=UPI0030814053